MLRKSIVIAVIAAVLCSPVSLFAQSKTKISMLLVNGKIFVADEKHSIAEAVAIDGERIVAVGKTAELTSKYVAAKTINLQGRLVTPGFNDAHVHFFNGALSLLTVDLLNSKSAEEAASRVGAKVKEVRPGEWIIGRGWDHTLWGSKFPDKSLLDKVAPNNPVLLRRVDGHVGWANSAALKLAGVDRNTKDPEGGIIERDADGEATGILKETASDFVQSKVPPPSDEQKAKAMELALDMAKKYGITSVQDNSGYQTTKLYRALLKEDKLTVRVSEWLNFEDSLDNLKAQRTEFNSFKDDPNRLRLGAVKGYVDGTLGSKTAAMLAPFSDDEGNSGIPRRPQEDLTAKVVALDKEGFQVTLHAIGDRANRMALNAYEVAKNPSRRHRIEHAQVVSPSDFKRFSELGVIASMQPTHAISDKRWAESRLGEYRVLGAYAWHFMQSYKVHVPFGTDFPVESIDPYQTLFAAVSRQDTEGDPVGGWQPQERLSMADAIRCHTYESAFAEFMEKEKGTIEAGKLADLVVHSKDLLTIPHSEVLKTEPLYTIFNGRVVFQK
jgi:predicted amidohydrolase YtcJ